MLVRGWAMCCITGIGNRSTVPNIALIALFCLRAPGAQLPAQEQGKPEQERCRHDQRRCQRLELSDHAGTSSFAAPIPLLALLLMTACDAAQALAGNARPLRAGTGNGPVRVPRMANGQAALDACAGPVMRGRIR